MSSVEIGFDFSRSKTIATSKISTGYTRYDYKETYKVMDVGNYESIHFEYNSNQILYFLSKSRSNQFIEIEEEYSDSQTQKDEAVALKLLYNGESSYLRAEQLLALQLHILIQLPKNTVYYIAHPHFYPEKKKTALRNAAAIAGIEYVNLVSNVDAMCAYFRKTQNLQRGTLVLFLDIGYMHISAYLCNFDQQIATILAETINPNVGSRYIDRMLFDQIWQQIENRGIEYANYSKTALLNKCSKLKSAISSNANNEQCHFTDFHPDMSISVNKKNVEDSIDSLLEKTIYIMRETISRGKADVSKIRNIVICVEDELMPEMKDNISREFRGGTILSLEKDAICKGCIMKNDKNNNFTVIPPCRKNSVVQITLEGGGESYTPLLPISRCQCENCKEERRSKREIERIKIEQWTLANKCSCTPENETDQTDDASDSTQMNEKCVDSYEEKMQQHLADSLTPDLIEECRKIHNLIVKNENAWRDRKKTIRLLSENISKILQETEKIQTWFNEVLSSRDAMYSVDIVNYMRSVKIYDFENNIEQDKEGIRVVDNIEKSGQFAIHEQLDSLLSELTNGINLCIVQEPEQIFDGKKFCWKLAPMFQSTAFRNFTEKIEFLTGMERIASLIYGRQKRLAVWKEILSASKYTLESEKDQCSENRLYEMENNLTGIRKEMQKSSKVFQFPSKIYSIKSEKRFETLKKEKNDMKNVIKKQQISRNLESIKSIIGECTANIKKHSSNIAPFERIGIYPVLEYYEKQINEIFYIRHVMEDYMECLEYCTKQMLKANQWNMIDIDFKQKISFYEKSLANVEIKISNSLKIDDETKLEQFSMMSDETKDVFNLLRLKSNLEFDKAFLEIRRKELNSENRMNGKKKELDPYSDDIVQFNAFVTEFKKNPYINGM